jgi:uncharacterized protein (DUF433 family)
MEQATRFSPADAASVLREPLDAVKKALDKGPVKHRLEHRGGAKIRTIDRRDLVFLYAIGKLKNELTPKARAEFYHALKHARPELGKSVDFGRFHIDIGDFVDEVDKRVARLKDLGDQVEIDADGNEVIKGTTIEAHRIAALLDGELKVKDILEDYPSLSEEQVLAAKAYADAHPKPGRPYPRTTAKRALRAAGLDALDEVLGRPDDAQGEPDGNRASLLCEVEADPRRSRRGRPHRRRAAFDTERKAAPPCQHEHRPIPHADHRRIPSPISGCVDRAVDGRADGGPGR